MNRRPADPTASRTHRLELMHRYYAGFFRWLLNQWQVEGGTIEEPRATTTEANPAT